MMMMTMSVGSSLFEFSALWFHLFAIFPLAVLSRASAACASAVSLSISGLDALEWVARSVVLETIERIVRGTTTTTTQTIQKTTRTTKGIIKTTTNNNNKEEEEEEEGSGLDPECLPTRFKHTCNGDVKLQLRKYEHHLMFKRELKVETLMCRPCPNYASIKANYGHAFHGVTKHGHVVQLERPSGWQNLVDAMKARGFEKDPTVPVKEHIAFVTTYAFEKVDARPWPDGKITRIVDVSQFSAGELTIEVLGFLRRMAKFGSAFLCERHGKVYLCKPSPTFRFVYALVAPLASAKTLDNVFILDTVDDMRAKISEEIDLKYVPKEFGGDCECEGGCWFGHPSEKALNAFARKLNGIEEEGHEKDDDALKDSNGAREMQEKNPKERETSRRASKL